MSQEELKTNEDVSGSLAGRNTIVIVFAIIVLVAVVAFGVMRTGDYGDGTAAKPTPPRQNNLGDVTTSSRTPDLVGTDATLEQELSDLESLNEDAEGLDDAFDDFSDQDIDF